jgi:hypothetical protein
MSPGETKIVQTLIVGLREQGYEIVSRDLIGRISDYFHVNAKPSDDLARSYMAALDAIILRGHTPSVPSTDQASSGADGVAAYERGFKDGVFVGREMPHDDNARARFLTDREDTERKQASNPSSQPKPKD